jgi:hypothetical protein
MILTSSDILEDSERYNMPSDPMEVTNFFARHVATQAQDLVIDLIIIIKK